jgi:hypothetical protein
MGKAMKKGKFSPSPIDPVLMKAWHSGFAAGVKQQRESDIENLVNLLEGLEDIPGIGDKTATKIRLFLLNKFENWSGQNGTK